MASSELLDHRGEVRLRVRADSLPELLAEAARALGNLERQDIQSEADTERHQVALAAPDLASLLVDWLNELVYLAETKRWVPEEAEIHEASEQRLSATVAGPCLVAPPSLVKAVTLHGASVRQTAEGWLAEVVLDV